jgi:molybdopterin-guanine dinucleotide biosynthesis protein A
LVAVDLPELSVDWLQRLMAQIAPDTGCVPMHQGRLEPLAAIYPNQAWAIAREQLETQKASVQEFCRRGLETGWMSRWELSAQDHHTLLNWNTPTDWPRGRSIQVP